MLAKQISGDGQQSRLLEKIARQTFRASEIVNSLLNFSRTSPAEFVDVDLNKVVNETLGLIGHQLQKAGIRVSLDLAPSLAPVQGNPGKLQQVFLNLFLNARDAMEVGGTLSVRTSSTATGVRTEVSDNGQGIPQENLERIYDPFFTTKGRARAPASASPSPTALSANMVANIEVESRPGEGTRFFLDLPYARKPVHA